MENKSHEGALAKLNFVPLEISTAKITRYTVMGMRG